MLVTTADSRGEEGFRDNEVVPLTATAAAAARAVEHEEGEDKEVEREGIAVLAVGKWTA